MISGDLQVAAVRVSHAAFHALCAHAHSVESEEIMGLLLGEQVAFPSGYVVCIVHGTYPVKRTDRRKDRVEVSTHDLVEASTFAEISAEQLMTLPSVKKKTGKHVTIVGWYHSHPHITIHPSHVDLRSQSIFELSSKFSVGLIVSCFDGTQRGNVQLGAFQSQSITSEPMTNAKSLSLEETEACGLETHDEFMVAVEKSHEGRGTPFEVPQEGKMHQNPLGRLWHPIFLFQGLASFDAYCTGTLLRVPKLLLEEERELYDRAQDSCRRNGDDIFHRIYNESIFMKSLCKLVDSVPIDLLNMMKDRVQRLRTQLEENRRFRTEAEPTQESSDEVICID